PDCGVSGMHDERRGRIASARTEAPAKTADCLCEKSIRSRMMVHGTETIRHRPDRRTICVGGTLPPPSQDAGPAPRRPPRRPQCHPLLGPRGLPVAPAAPRLPPLEYRPHLVSPLAQGRHLGEVQRGAAPTGPPPGGPAPRASAHFG